jgi:hypothetical protein
MYSKYKQELSVKQQSLDRHQIRKGNVLPSERPANDDLRAVALKHKLHNERLFNRSLERVNNFVHKLIKDKSLLQSKPM